MNKFDTIIVTQHWRLHSNCWNHDTITKIQNATKLPNEYYLQEDGEDTGDDLFELMERVVPKQNQMSSETYNNRILRQKNTLRTLRKQYEGTIDDDEIITKHDLDLIHASPVPFSGTRVAILCFDPDLPHVAGTVRRYRSKHYPELLSDVNKQTGQRVRLGYNNFEWFTQIGEQLLPNHIVKNLPRRDFQDN